MHTFRFNPVFNQWVLLGTSVSGNPLVEDRHLLDVGKHKQFVAAHHPKQPFLLEPDKQSDHANSDQVYASQAPVGEYEFLLYKGDRDLFDWTAKEWEGWFTLAQQRVSQLHHNPHLHFLHLSLNSTSRHTIDGYQRVGDLIATSHPLCGMSTLMDVEIAQKIQKKEGIFRLHEDEWCTVMVPSAPAHDRELWIMPTQYRASFATMDAKERKNYSEILALLLSHLKNEFAHDEYQLSLHTALSDTKQASTWWIQLHKADPGVESPIAIKPLPEVFMRQLKRSLE